MSYVRQMFGVLFCSLVLAICGCGGGGSTGGGDDGDIEDPPLPGTAKLTVVNDFSGKVFNRLYFFKTGDTPSMDYLLGNGMFYGESFTFNDIEPGLYTMHAQFVNAAGGISLEEYRSSVSLQAGETWTWYLDETWGSTCYVGTLVKE